MPFTWTAARCRANRNHCSWEPLLRSTSRAEEVPPSSSPANSSPADTPRSDRTEGTARQRRHHPARPRRILKPQVRHTLLPGPRPQVRPRNASPCRRIIGRGAGPFLRRARSQSCPPGHRRKRPVERRVGNRQQSPITIHSSLITITFLVRNRSFASAWNERSPPRGSRNVWRALAVVGRQD